MFKHLIFVLYSCLRTLSKQSPVAMVAASGLLCFVSHCCRYKRYTCRAMEYAHCLAFQKVGHFGICRSGTGANVSFRRYCFDLFSFFKARLAKD